MTSILKHPVSTWLLAAAFTVVAIYLSGHFNSYAYNHSPWGRVAGHCANLALIGVPVLWIGATIRQCLVSHFSSGSLLAAFVVAIAFLHIAVFLTGDGDCFSPGSDYYSDTPCRSPTLRLMAEISRCALLVAVPAYAIKRLRDCLQRRKGKRK